MAAWCAPGGHHRSARMMQLWLLHLARASAHKCRPGDVVTRPIRPPVSQPPLLP